jgi:hypothetical protein
LILPNHTATDASSFTVNTDFPVHINGRIRLSYSKTMAAEEYYTRDVEDILVVMRQQEMTTYRRRDYLSGNEGFATHVVDGAWRQRIVEWMYGVVDHCSLRRDSVAIAAYYLDTCVEKGLVESRQEFQLAAMTALQLAIKLYDSTMVKLDSMVKLGRGLFTEHDVVNMERKIINSLEWRLHPPTSICFLRQFLRLLPASVAPPTRYLIAEVARFIAEISVCLCKFISLPPSMIAYAGMLIAIERIDETTLTVDLRDQIHSAMSKIADLDHKSILLIEVVSMLHQSLENNVSLRELMNTIGAQCQGGYRKIDSSEFGQFQTSGAHSPRDVREGV